jgi:Pvc16 N-terminal domain
VLFDLSAVTDSLLGLVRSSWNSAPIWAELGKTTATFVPDFTGLAPDAIRQHGQGPQLSLFLYHVESDNAHESSFWTSQMLTSPGLPVRYLPLALDLFYLLSAYSERSYVEEQQAMSVALRIFHANGLVIHTASPPAWRLTLTMEHRSYDEISRLWTATTVPLRLSVVYRAALVFLAPDQPDAGPPAVETLNADVNTLGAAGGGDVITETSPPGASPP